MKHSGLIILSTVLVLTISSCDKKSQPTNEESQKIVANAEIVGFNQEKCGCCWGWVIVMNGDTIKTDSLPNSKYNRL